jgi:hypothetical protein
MDRYYIDMPIYGRVQTWRHARKMITYGLWQQMSGPKMIAKDISSTLYLLLTGRKGPWDPRRWGCAPMHVETEIGADVGPTILGYNLTFCSLLCRTDQSKWHRNSREQCCIVDAQYILFYIMKRE